MDEVTLTCSSSDECGNGDTGTQTDVPDLRSQVLQLLNTKLSKNSTMALQEGLWFMQRASYYLELQCDDLPPAAHNQQRSLHLSDVEFWSLIDQRRLQRAMTLANSHVKLLLAFLQLLCHEIMRGCQELEDFIGKCDAGLVEMDMDMVASVEEKLEKTQRYMQDFDSRIRENLGPLDLQNVLTLNTGNLPVLQLSTSLAIKLPVVFDRLRSRVTSDTVNLYWEVAGQQARDPDRFFEIHIKILHPTFAEPCQTSHTALYNMQVNNLIPDRYYQFFIKRADAVNLVYGAWNDFIILKTLCLTD